eukprot:12813_5
MELDGRARQCLCVVGNCFALQKEHESALKFFQRSVDRDVLHEWLNRSEF